MEETKKRDELQTLNRTFDIIHLLKENSPTHLSEIADQLDLAESSVHRHLRTLENLRYVSRDGVRYQLGLRFMRLGTAARMRNPAYSKIEPYVEQLAEQTEERAHFIVEDHGLGVYLYQSTGDNAVNVGTNIGRQVHLHSSAAGKAILSHYSKDRVNEILDKWGLPKNTKYTITDRDTLFEELETVEERGFALNREETVEDLHVVAVPVVPNRTIIGTLCVAGPSYRLRGEWFEEGLPELLLSTANELELNIIYDRSDQPEKHLVE
jgi:DNA-binding IclR family transcriptional regulator